MYMVLQVIKNCQANCYTVLQLLFVSVDNTFKPMGPVKKKMHKLCSPVAPIWTSYMYTENALQFFFNKDVVLSGPGWTIAFLFFCRFKAENILVLFLNCTL